MGIYNDLGFVHTKTYIGKYQLDRSDTTIKKPMKIEAINILYAIFICLPMLTRPLTKRIVTKLQDL